MNVEQTGQFTGVCFLEQPNEKEHVGLLWSSKKSKFAGAFCHLKNYTNKIGENTKNISDTTN